MESDSSLQSNVETQSSSAKLVVWRIEGRKFEPRQEMRSSGDHFTTLNSAHTLSELALRDAMPDGHDIRATSLYAWREETWARWNWKKEPEKYLYKLEVDEADIRHIGDVSYYSDIGDALASGQSAELPIQSYIASALFVPARHFKPRVELLVGKAMVLERFDPISAPSTS